MSAAGTLSTLPGRQFSKHVVSQQIEDLYELNGTLYENRRAMEIIPERKQMYSLPTFSGQSNGVNTSFNGQQVVFRVQVAAIPGRVTNAQLEFTLAETSGTNSVTAAPAPFLISQIWTSLNGNMQSQDQILYPQQFYLNYQYMTTEKLVLRNGGDMNLLNINPYTLDPKSGTAIAPGGTQLVVLNLETSLLTDLIPNSLKQDVYIVVTLPTSAPVLAGSGTLQLNSVNLRLFNEKNDLTDSKALSALAAKPYVVNYLHNVQMTQPGTLTAGSKTTVPLQAIAGSYCQSLTIMITPVGNSASALTTFYSLNGSNSDASNTQGLIDFKISSGQSILGGSGEPPFFQRASAADMCGNAGTLTAKQPIYTIFMGHNPMFYKTGNTKGGVLVNNSDYLELTPGSGFTTGSYNIIVLGSRMDSVVQNNGQLEHIN